MFDQDFEVFDWPKEHNNVKKTQCLGSVVFSAMFVKDSKLETAKVGLSIDYDSVV